MAGERLTPDEGLRLLESHDLAALGPGGRRRDAAAASGALPHVQHRPQHQLHERLHGGVRLLRVLSHAEVAEGYVLERDELYQKIQETVDLGGDQILMQGGLHPAFKLEWYEELLRDIKSRFPQVNIHGFSPPEIHHFTRSRSCRCGRCWSG